MDIPLFSITEATQLGFGTPLTLINYLHRGSACHLKFYSVQFMTHKTDTKHTSH